MPEPLSSMSSSSDTVRESGVDPPLGAILLHNKKEPVCERETPWDPSEPLVVLRACLDVAPLQAKLHSLAPEMWEDEHQKGNVKLVRPAHDAWGIKKIVFTFCDDVRDTRTVLFITTPL